jgi:hypothetical protein
MAGFKMQPYHLAVAENRLPETRAIEFGAAQVAGFKTAIYEVETAEIHRGKITVEELAVVVGTTGQRALQDIFLREFLVINIFVSHIGRSLDCPKVILGDYRSLNIQSSRRR